MSVPSATGLGVRGPVGTRVLPGRYLHPVAWWAWAVGLMVAAARSTNPLLLGLICGTVAVVVAARRPDAPWAGAFRASLRLGVVILVLRTVLQVLMGAPVGLHVAFTLPEVGLPEWMAGLRLGGTVTWESVLVGLTEGLRLATMIACVGAANSLAAPSRLLRSVPAALYEVGVAVVVALTFAPHLLDDARRVRGARRLRGHDEGRLAGFARSAGPVLDGGLERSVQLAAAMDSRGYGRTGDVGPRARLTRALFVLGGFAGILVGLYGLFDTAAPGWLGWPALAVGAGVAVAGLRAAGRRTPRSSYRPDPWRSPEWMTVAAGCLVAAGVILLADPADLSMPLVPLQWPTVAVGPTLAVLVAAGPALWTPPLPAEVVVGR